MASNHTKGYIDSSGLACHSFTFVMILSVIALIVAVEIDT